MDNRNGHSFENDQREPILEEVNREGKNIGPWEKSPKHVLNSGRSVIQNKMTKTTPTKTPLRARYYSRKAEG